MKRIFLLLICTLASFLYFKCSAQTIVNISKPQLELRNNKVIIQFDILNSNYNDIFAISIDVTDGDGKKIDARALSGDIGQKIKGGSGKEITWNLTDDNIVIDAMLYFQIQAQALPPENNISVDNSPSNTSKPATSSREAPPTTSPKKLVTISRGSAIAQSLLFPGLGLTKIKNGNPHWLKGISAYSCLAGGIFMNRASNTNYLSYQESSIPTERDDLFNTSLKQSNISNALIYSAVGIWIIDFIWTVAGSKEKSTALNVGQEKGISIQPDYNSEFNKPVLAFRYKF